MEYLVVDVDNRQINIPESIAHLGVKDDNETRTLNFRMPKIYKGLDMSGYTIEINYINAKGKADSALAGNIQVGDEEITFQWCAGGTAYAKDGKVRFLVYTYLENEDLTKTNEWHTTWAALEVLDGGNVEEQIAEENPRIIEEMLRRILELENGETGGTKNAVQYIEQELTDEQKAQARVNIGAVSEEEVSAKVKQAISEQSHFRFVKVDALPDIGEENVIYLVPGEQEEENIYEEYLFVDGVPELIGSTQIDLSGYAPKATTLAGYGITDGVTKGELGQVQEQIADQFNAEQDTATLGEELVNANNWTLGTGWSGSFASGFTHASGNTEPLTFSPSITVGKLYQVTFKSSVYMTTSNLFVQVGNSTQFNLYGEDTTNDTGNVSIGVLAVDTSGLVFTPDSSFAGTLTDISLKEITGSYEAVQQYFDANDAVSFEIHVTPRGLENVFIGQATGEMNTTGHENVGVGVNVLMNNTSGFWNVGIGKDCLMNNVGGSRNLAIGYNALRNNEVGQRNVALGTFAMTQMENGNWNIAIGSDSMNEATGGNKNTAVGFNTLVHNGGDNNVAVGSDVLSQNTSGAGNIGIGQGALAKNTTGINNVCIGYNSSTASTTAKQNVGLGWATLYKLTTGNNNVAIGCGAGKTLTTGKSNIIIGSEPTVEATGNYQLNIGDLLKGSLNPSDLYLILNGGLRLPNIATTPKGNDEVYAEEWTFILEDGSTVTKKVLMK